ncbi:Histone-lysine N-methyltransferase EZA1 [Euphorbia peplus]|nr:Histone-lysine N-methyltransferase EZA1 [Euphorbia peplus]
MVSKSTDSSFNPPKLQGEQSNEGVENLPYKMNQLKKLIQAERMASIKEKVEKNKKKLESDVSQLISATSKKNALLTEMDFSRIGNPICKYSGYASTSGDKDYISGHEVMVPTSAKLPLTERIPPYTTWIFLERNQRMAEDQSVVGRRRIYYDQHGSEALICSDSEEDIADPEEEKHDFSEGEDRILWMAFQEYELSEEVLSLVSQFIGVSASEIQERCSVLKEKFDEEQNEKNSADSLSQKGISMDKSLSAALDSFDNLFCRRCLLFDCRLHGCSQTVINPSEKQPYWSEYEDDRKPCSEQCCLKLRVNGMPGKVKTATTEEEKRNSVTSKANMETEDDICFSEKEIPVARDYHFSEPSSRASNLDTPGPAMGNQDHLRKRIAPHHTDSALDNNTQVPDDLQGSSSKKLKRLLSLDTVSGDAEPISCREVGTKSTTDEIRMTIKDTINCPSEHASKEDLCSGTKKKIGDEATSIIEVPETNQSSSTERHIVGVTSRSEWKPIEKELYLKGVEIFGKNSCLIARNLLSGLKTCIEVSNYMYNNGATMPRRSATPSSVLEENGMADADYMEQEMPTRSRLFRRRGRTRKLKYSWKSTGHPSIWKRIADGKNQSSKQYTPCGCQSMCGKQCPCLHNGTCCEKYCGCSKSCKNRFRGCHCAKSQCRSRQCPCFAAGRECDPDVCRNCWISCGDGTLGEAPKRGDGQCGNMRLLLRQQQRILLAKSDVAGWGAFLKNSVNKNDYLGEYTGELISHREADKRGKIYDRANSSFLFDLNDQYVLDAYRKGDKLKFANHSSNPNCYAKVMLVAGDHRVGIFANEHIDASEELFYDYRYGPDQAPVWARKPEGSKRDESTVSQGRAKKHQSH